GRAAGRCRERASRSDPEPEGEIEIVTRAERGAERDWQAERSVAGEGLQPAQDGLVRSVQIEPPEARLARTEIVKRLLETAQRLRAPRRAVLGLGTRALHLHALALECRRQVAHRQRQLVGARPPARQRARTTLELLLALERVCDRFGARAGVGLGLGLDAEHGEPVLGGPQALLQRRSQREQVEA